MGCRLCKKVCCVAGAPQASMSLVRQIGLLLPSGGAVRRQKFPCSHSLPKERLGRPVPQAQGNEARGMSQKTP